MLPVETVCFMRALKAITSKTVSIPELPVSSRVRVFFSTWSFHPYFLPLTFYAQWLSIPNSSRKGRLFQHRPFLYLEGHFTSAALALDCVIIEECPASPSFLQNWASFCSSGITLPGSSSWRLKGKQVLCFCLSVWHRKGAVEDNSIAIPVNPFQTRSALPVLAPLSLRVHYRKNSPGPSYRLLSLMLFNVSILS